MARKRSLPRLPGRDRGASESNGAGDVRETRWQRRARSREARVNLAERPSEFAEPTRMALPSGNGGPTNGNGGGRGRLKKLRIALVLFGLAILAFVSWVFGIMMAVASDLPQLEARAQYETAQNSVVKDRHGVPITTLTNNEGRILVPSEDIAPVMKEAVVAIEDQRFYEHRGVDFQGIGRAIWADLTSGSPAQGASTITQQFVKNALAAENDRTVFQKLREAALAYQLERNWDKDKILTEYLNSIYFGEGAYGIEAAAHTYFGWNHPGCGTPDDRCASELLPWEAALLAGMISSPSGYSPRANPDAATARRNLTLQNMAAQGYITEAEVQDYEQQPIPKPGEIETPREDSKAPYFTSWLRQQLVDRYGAGEAFGGGLEVHSTLDLGLQTQAQSIVDNRVTPLGLNSAAVVLDNDTAEVLAMVGGQDYQQAPFNLATQGRRQPGSSFKPFTLLTALSQGKSPDAVFSSQPKTFPFTIKVTGERKHGKPKEVHDLFRVNNYDDSYLGSASIATGTTYSDNSVYAELGLNVGLPNIAKTAEDMGIDTSLETQNEYRIDGGLGDGKFHPYNPALILGGLETGVTPLEMAHAYETLATDGTRVSGSLAASANGPVAIKEVDDSDGDPVDTDDGTSGVNEKETEPGVISPTVAETAKNILRTVVDSGTGQNADNGDDIWGKTGTTDDNGDAWFVGSTKDVTIAVWVGHADSVKPMETEYNGGPVDGGTIPAELFNEILSAYDATQKSKPSDESTDTTTAPTYTAPPATTTPTPTTPTTPTAPPPDDTAPPADTGGGGDTGGGTGGETGAVG
jgi:penicillin-binding protein 1A